MLKESIQSLTNGLAGRRRDLIGTSVEQEVVYVCI